MSTLATVLYSLLGLFIAALYIGVMCMAVILEAENVAESDEAYRARVLRIVNDQNNDKKYRKL